MEDRNDEIYLINEQSSTISLPYHAANYNNKIIIDRDYDYD